MQFQFLKCSVVDQVVFSTITTVKLNTLF